MHSKILTCRIAHLQSKDKTVSRKISEIRKKTEQIRKIKEDKEAEKQRVIIKRIYSQKC